MHNTFYASGFLYHPETHQILLQQAKSNNNNTWSLFGIEHDNKETLSDRFLKLVNESLNIKLNSSSIFSVYNYTVDGQKIYIFYAQTKKMGDYVNNNITFSWFNFKQVKKLSLSTQAKQDIIISQRVIDSSIRRDLGLQTIG